MGSTATNRDPRRSVRPVLMLLVYGALLVIIGATATGQAALISSQSQSNLLNATVNADATLVRAFLDYARLTPSDLSSTTIEPERVAVIEAGANILIAGSAIFNNNVSVKEGIDTLRRSWEK